MRLSVGKLLLSMGLVLISLTSPVKAAYMDAPALIRKGNGSFSNGQYNDAARAYKQALAIESSADAVYNLAVTYHHRLKYYGKAIHYYERFLELEPNAVEAAQVRTWLAEVRYKLFPEQVEKNSPLRRPSAQDLMLLVGSDDLETFQANEYVKQKNYRQAIRIYEQTFVRKESLPACFNLAVLYDFELGFLQKAIFYYQKFLVMAPDNLKADQVSKWLSEAQVALDRQRGHFYQGTALHLRQP